MVENRGMPMPVTRFLPAQIVESKDFPGRIEGPSVRLHVLMPLSYMTGKIAMLSELLGKGRMSGRHSLTLVFQGKEGPARQHHGSTGHANRNVGPTHDMSVGKGSPLCYKPIQIWRLNLLATQCRYGVETLVVGKNEYNIRVFHLLKCPFNNSLRKLRVQKGARAPKAQS